MCVRARAFNNASLLLYFQERETDSNKRNRLFGQHAFNHSQSLSEGGDVAGWLYGVSYLDDANMMSLTSADRVVQFKI